MTDDEFWEKIREIPEMMSTSLHHPTVPEEECLAWPKADQLAFMVTRCCNRHSRTFWALRRCEGCGAIVRHES